MRKMLKDQAQTERRVVAARRRAVGTQKAHVARRQARRDRRYRNSAEYKGLQAFLKIDFTQWQKSILRMIEGLKDVAQKYSRAMVISPRMAGKTQAQKLFEPFIEEMSSSRKEIPRMTEKTQTQESFNEFIEPYFEEEKPRMIYSEMESQEKAALTTLDPKVWHKFKL